MPPRSWAGWPPSRARAALRPAWPARRRWSRALSAADTRAALADPGPAGAELRFILLAAFTEALANTTRHLRELLSEPQGAKPPELDRLLALLHGAKR